MSPIDLGNLEINDAEELNNNVSSENVSPVLNSEEQDGNDNKILIDNGNEVENNIKSEKSPSPEPNVESKINLVDVTNDLEEVKVEKDNSLEEINFDIENLEEEDTISLKKPNEVYFEIWREARLAAKQARKQALQAYLNAKNIKATYMLDEIDDDSSDEFDNYLDSLSEKEVASVV